MRLNYIYIYYYYTRVFIYLRYEQFMFNCVLYVVKITISNDLFLF